MMAAVNDPDTAGAKGVHGRNRGGDGREHGFGDFEHRL